VNDPFWLTRDQVREVDRRAVEEFGVPSIVLMENAGRGAAELLMRLNPERLPVAILCGPGNNGGDGFVVARHLSIQQCPVHIWVALSRGDSNENTNPESIESQLSADARVNYRIAVRSGISAEILRGKLSDWQREMIRSDLAIQSGWIVDGLFGTGLRAPPGPPFDELIAAANLSKNPILALDLPSGLECDEGVPLGLAIHATHTATFVARKKGFLAVTAQEWIGEVHVVDIGAPKVLVDQFRH
jgi:NAD(P)H-hydrate epimerase